ncbi:helicase [mine drainage metagenome]|uniref:Helicase n=1 Tax=mine drainage metagenome TaxID=410659 RepID=T0ZDF3_9ZZZZ
MHAILRTSLRDGDKRKALVFTESRRTQEYLKTFLEANGYAGQIVLFNGTRAKAKSGADRVQNISFAPAGNSNIIGPD